jgi:hypothetical protein
MLQGGMKGFSVAFVKYSVFSHASSTGLDAHREQVLFLDAIKINILLAPKKFSLFAPFKMFFCPLLLNYQVLQIFSQTQAQTHKHCPKINR